MIRERTMREQIWVHTIRLEQSDVETLEDVMRETGFPRRVDALRFLIREKARAMRASAKEARRGSR